MSQTGGLLPMKEFLTALLACACATAPAAAIADVPSQLQAPNDHRPPIVSNLVVSRSGQGKATLTWTMSAAAAYHITSVSVHRTGGATPENAKLGAVQHWSDWSVAAGTPYHYGVCAHDSGGEVGCAYANYTAGANPGP
jgi:hypothetical protein